MKKLNYARLALMRGVNLQKGQILVISAPLWTADFAHLLMEEAFALGARDVVIRYDDPQAERIRLLHAPEEALCDVPRWMSESQTCYADKGAAYLRISSAKPGMMDGVDAARLGMRQRALNAPLRAFNLRRMANEVAWSVICVPNAEWAQQVYPGKDAQAALDALWEDMYSCCYVTQESPVAGWDAHVEDMQRMVKRLNGLRPVALHLKNGLGTDLHLRMCEEGVFAGGICHCPEPDGVCFAPNIPTEEILTTPHRLSAEGVVVNTLPLVYNGSLIDRFRLTFRNGEVTDWSCEVGAELLREIRELPGKLILEIEKPDDAKTQRRLRFYEREGLTLAPFGYDAPGYQAGTGDCALQLMSEGAMSKLEFARHCAFLQEVVLDCTAGGAKPLCIWKE